MPSAGAVWARRASSNWIRWFLCRWRNNRKTRNFRWELKTPEEERGKPKHSSGQNEGVVEIKIGNGRRREREGEDRKEMGQRPVPNDERREGEGERSKKKGQRSKPEGGRRGPKGERRQQKAERSGRKAGTWGPKDEPSRRMEETSGRKDQPSGQMDETSGQMGQPWERKEETSGRKDQPSGQKGQPWGRKDQPGSVPIRDPWSTERIGACAVVSGRENLEAPWRRLPTSAPDFQST